MELRILGPFEVFDDSGRRVKLPTGRESALLAVLLLRRGEVVSTDALVDALWGEEPPSTAAKAVQGYISHLRRVLEQSGQDGPLQTRPPGYLLRIDDSRVDARRFEKLAAEGWRLLDDDPESALATFEEALAFWRGPALGEFAFAEFAQPEIHRLEELRLETIEGRIEALLRLGRHEAVVAELQTRVEEHPLRERLRGQLMLALYRSGRQADALDLYRRGRRLLADELGLDPGRSCSASRRRSWTRTPRSTRRSGARHPGERGSPGLRRRLRRSRRSGRRAAGYESSGSVLSCSQSLSERPRWPTSSSVTRRPRLPWSRLRHWSSWTLRATGSSPRSPSARGRSRSWERTDPSGSATHRTGQRRRSTLRRGRS